MVAPPDIPYELTPELRAKAERFPYHAEAWQKIGQLGDIALQTFELPTSDDEPGAYIFTKWQTRRLAGIAGRLEQPQQNAGDDTVNTLSFEVAGDGRASRFGELFIEPGLRRPVARNPRDWGVVVYSVNQGFLLPPRGPFLRRLALKHTNNVWDDPEKVATGVEKVVQEILGDAAGGWQNLAKVEPFPNQRWQSS